MTAEYRKEPVPSAADLLLATSPHRYTAESLARHLALRQMPGYLVRRLDSRAAALFEEHTGQSALTPRQFGLLQVVHAAGVIKQSELATRLDLDRSTLGEMLNRMVARGLLLRRSLAGDRRTSELELTDAGRDVLLANVAAAVDAQVAFLEPLPEYLRPVFMKCLELLCEADLAPTRESENAERRSDVR